MGTHFYKFNRSQLGNLIFQGKYQMKYFEEQEYGILFKDTEIENAKDSFVIDRYRTVKSGKSWLNNHLKKLNEKRK
jgi:hypothetical protein